MTLPFADYSDPASPNKVAADAAFLAEFGFNQADPGVSRRLRRLQ
jgi:flagellar hook-associated protein 3 FlgL